MKTVTIHNRTYAVPYKWDHLSSRQLIAVMEVLYGNYDIQAALLKLLKIITGMGWYRWCRTSIIDKAEFLDLPGFLINENDLTKQCIPVYKGFYGPDDDFNNLTGHEFVFSEHYYFTSFTKAEDGNGRQMNEQGLNNLVASLYRPKKRFYNHRKNPDGDPRKAFNENLAMYYAKNVVNKWPMPAKLAIFTWYECCRQKMIESNPDIFSGGSGEPARHGLLSVMRVIAESGIHGDFEKVTKMFVKMWMIELNEKADEAKRMEESPTT